MAEEGIAAHWKLQGRARRRSARRSLLPVDAAAARIAAGSPRPAGVHPEPQGRALSRRRSTSSRRRGSVKALPRGATPIDFAYSDPHRPGPSVRRRARQRQDGAAPHAPQERRHRRDRHGRPGIEPSRDWLNFVATSRARSKIKHLIHAEEKRARVELGTQGVREGGAPLRSESERRFVDGRGVRQGAHRFRRRQVRRSVRGDRLRQDSGEAAAGPARAGRLAAREARRKARWRPSSRRVLGSGEEKIKVKGSTT